MDKEHQMTRGEWQMFNHQKKIDKLFENNRYYCRCGHSVVILPKETRTFCSFCGHWVYKDKKAQKENIKRIEKENQEKIARFRKEKFKTLLRERLKNAD